MSFDVHDYSKVIAGDVGFTLTHGPGRYTIPWMQALMGDGSVWEHVALGIGDNVLMEAMPPRARIRSVQAEDDMLWFRLPLDEIQRNYISTQPWVDFKQGAIKYGWSAYLNIALLKWGIRPDFVKDHVANSRRRMCSQLADDYLTQAGFSVLADVLPGEVTPGDLAFRLGNDNTIRSFRLDGAPTWTRPKRG